MQTIRELLNLESERIIFQIAFSAKTLFSRINRSDFFKKE